MLTAALKPNSTTLIKAALSTLYYTGLGRAVSRVTSGSGVILTMHRIEPDHGEAFAPNRILSLTPSFLAEAISEVQSAGFDIVSLDEAHRRMVDCSGDRPFACFTFDDGYRDNRIYAYPIFKRHGLPFGIYIPTDYPDGRGDLWWVTLERVIASVDVITSHIAGRRETIRADTPSAKQRAFDRIYWWLRQLDEVETRQFVKDLCASTGYDASDLCSSLIMSWDEIRTLAEDPLVTIGAHTRGHYALAKLSYATAKAEMIGSVDRIEKELGERPLHFSFPYGCECSAGPREFQLAHEIGMKTAVTTRKGMIFPEHAKSLTALPRISLNGLYQDRRYVAMLLSGAPTYLWNGIRRGTG